MTIIGPRHQLSGLLSNNRMSRERFVKRAALPETTSADEKLQHFRTRGLRLHSSSAILMLLLRPSANFEPTTYYVSCTHIVFCMILLTTVAFAVLAVRADCYCLAV